MKYLVLGDIHGQYDRLIEILDKYFNISEKVIFLGDYIDKNKESLKSLKYILELKKSNLNKVELLWGNHDIFMINSLVYHDERMFNLWFSINKAFETTFFNHVSGNDRVLFRNGYDEFVDEYFKKFIADEELVALAKEMLFFGKLFYMDNKIFCVHGGLPIKVVSRNSYVLLPFYNVEGIKGLELLESDYKIGKREAIEFFSKTKNEDPTWFNGANVYERITLETYNNFLKNLGIKEIYVGHRTGISVSKFPKGDSLKTLNLGSSDIGFFYGEV